MNAQTTEIVPYSTPEGLTIGVRFDSEEPWLTQKELGRLYGVGKAAVSKHLADIFESGEMSQDSVVSILETTAIDGKTYRTRYYNLDAILAVGYRVKSQRGTDFRIWATKQLRRDIEGTNPSVHLAPQVETVLAKMLDRIEAQGAKLAQLEARLSSPVEAQTRIGKRKGDELREQIRLLGEASARICPKHSAKAWAQKRNLRLRNAVGFPMGQGRGWDNLPSSQLDTVNDKLRELWQDITDMSGAPAAPVDAAFRQIEMRMAATVTPIVAAKAKQEASK